MNLQLTSHLDANGKKEMMANCGDMDQQKRTGEWIQGGTREVAVLLDQSVPDTLGMLLGTLS
jgi:hypothetical protein